jgi:hypothetical protein
MCRALLDTGSTGNLTSINFEGITFENRGETIHTYLGEIPALTANKVLIEQGLQVRDLLKIRGNVFPFSADISVVLGLKFFEDNKAILDFSERRLVCYIGCS